MRIRPPIRTSADEHACEEYAEVYNTNEFRTDRRPRVPENANGHSMIRQPAVAGSFYPDGSGALSDALEGMTFPAADLTARGIVVPHAGYVYSGHIAGEVYSHVRLPRRHIMLCPNHTGRGRPLAIMSEGAWETPLGQAQIDTSLAEILHDLHPELDDDAEAHRFEHGLEVQIPFLQFLIGSKFQFVPITIGTTEPDRLTGLGHALSRAVSESGDDILIVASSDMNHYESDHNTRIKDRMAIDRILARDPEGLHRTVFSEDISMCGVAPTVAMLTAVNDLGANRAELIRYGTSGDIFGDRERVVGYAGIVIS